MTEQATAVAESVTSAPAEQTLSLEDVYKEAGITEPQAQPQVVAAPQYAPPQSQDIPDPYDTEKHSAFLRELVQKQTALDMSLQEIRGKSSQIERETAIAKLEEDIKEASDFVSKEAGIENTALSHFELNERARTDAKFKQLWEGRNNSPAHKAALNKALGVISKEISKKYEVRVDPQLVANRRALKASQQSSATTESEENGSPLDGLNGLDFERAWANMVRTNN